MNFISLYLARDRKHAQNKLLLLPGCQVHLTELSKYIAAIRKMNLLRKVRNNWKKTVFFGGLLAYGGDYGYDQFRYVTVADCLQCVFSMLPSFRINRLMRSVCAEAKTYGDQLLPDGANNRRVIVILNPTADKRSAEKKFQKYCGPILFLSGIRVDIVKTESEGFARNYIETEIAELPDAILVAGGDGTLSEAVSGLMRRSVPHSCPIGVLPVGRTNTIAGRIFPTMSGGRLREVEQLTSAAISVVRGKVAKKDVLKIEILPERESTEDYGPKKPIYALASIKWGAFRDAVALRDKYWYYGGLRQRAAILFNAFRTSRINFDCKGLLTTTPPCEGCANCFESPNQEPAYKSSNWWSSFVPTRSSKKESADPSRSRLNPECGHRLEIQMEDVSELLLTTRNVEDILETPPRLNIRLGSAKVSKTDWIQDAWQRTNDELNSKVLDRIIGSRTMELIPEQRTKADGSEEFYSIDNEAFEVKPIRVTLLPERVSIFTL